MFSQADLDRLIDAMRQNGVAMLEVATEGDKLKLELAHTVPQSAGGAPVPTAPSQTVAAKSPCIGRFVARGVDDGLTPLKGDALVNAGDTLGYVVQGLARAPVVAPLHGSLRGDIPSDGTVFGYGDPVFNVEAST